MRAEGRGAGRPLLSDEEIRELLDAWHERFFIDDPELRRLCGGSGRAAEPEGGSGGAEAQEKGS